MPALEHHLGTNLPLNTFQKDLSMATYHNIKLNPAMELKEGSAKWHTSRVGKEAPFFLQTSQWGYFCERNHTRLLHWPQQNKNFMPYSRKNRLKSVPGKLTLCNVPCQWEECSLAQPWCCQKGVWFFFSWELPPCILPVSSQLCNA